ncbi:MAG: hypothetical protein LBI35_04430 [Burkholderiales bacterium]|jgi:hypothetical protein|nr:hypothetical protein [Burkholderiales bacterium]
MSYSAKRANEILGALGNPTETPHPQPPPPPPPPTRLSVSEITALLDWLKNEALQPPRQEPAARVLKELTLRDIFAGFALAGILGCFKEFRGCDSLKTRVALAFKYADEMLATRRE